MLLSFRVPIVVDVARRTAVRTSEISMVATNEGLFTQSKPEDRKVVPEDPGDRVVFKIVYVVLESQYQASLTAACKRINAMQVPSPKA